MCDSDQIIIQQQERELDALRAELAEATDACNGLHDMVKVLDPENASLLTRIAGVEAANERLQEELEAAACQLGAQDAKIRRLEEKLRIAKLTAQDNRDWGEAAIADMNALRAEVKRLEEELARLKRPTGYHDVEEFYKD
jgi:chromosome segregation ATPase